MKATQYDRYGGPEVLQLREVPAPQAGPGEVLVRVAAAALNPKDVLVRAGKFRRMAGKQFPKGCGYDFSGQVQAVGAGVSAVKAGEAVFGMVNGWQARSCAEWLVCRPDELTLTPPNVTAAQAAGLPLAGQTALQALIGCARLKPGQRVLVHGASGGVGTLAVQIAKALGAQVTALCGEGSASLLSRLGADAVLDYRQQPPEKLQGRFDVFFDVFGNQSLARVRHLLGPRGCYVSTVPSARNILDHLRTRYWPGQRARLVVVRCNTADLQTLAGWLCGGQLQAVIAATLPLAQVAKGHEMLASKRTHGKIIITIGDTA